MPKNKILRKQEFIITKDGDEFTELEHIYVDFEYYEYDGDVGITIRDGKKEIVILGDAALAFKQIMTDNNYIFKQ